MSRRRIVREHATWAPLYPGPPRCHVNLRISRIAGSLLQISSPGKPRIPGFRYSRFLPPVHARINGLDQVGKSPFAISMCMGLFPLPLDSPMCDEKRSFVRLWLKPLAAPSRSNDPQNLVSLLDDSQVADSSPLGRVLSSATLLRCSLHRVDFSRSSRLSLPSFVSGFSQRAFTCSTHPSIFDHSPSVEILPGSVHLRVQPSSAQTCY
jgi:hypothetical protein